MKNKTILLSALLVALFSIAFMSGCKKEEVKNLPTACFTQSADSVDINESVNFDNCSAGATSYLWTFGDGETSTSANPSHTYDTGGTYTVTLKATNADGTATKTRTLFVQSVTALAYAGGFNVTDICTSGTYPYISSITPSGYGVLINNFGDFGEGVSANISGYNIVISNYPIAGGAATVSGSGTLSSDFNTITITYQYTSGSYTDNCVATFTRI